MPMNVSSVKPTKYDALVVLAVLLLAASLSAWSLRAARETDSLTVVVTVDGAEVERTPLSDYAGQHRYESRGYTLTVDSRDAQVAVTQSDCPNQDCKRSGAITRAGQSIVCLPARISIALVGEASDYDVIAG